MLTAAQRESAMEALSRMMADSEGATSGLLDRLEVLEAQLAAKLRELDALQQQPHIPSGGGGIGTSSMCSSLGITSEGVLTESARTQDSLTPTPFPPPYISAIAHTAPTNLPWLRGIIGGPPGGVGALRVPPRHKGLPRRDRRHGTIWGGAA